jgi:hypothetical protein
MNLELNEQQKSTLEDFLWDAVRGLDGDIDSATIAILLDILYMLENTDRP